MSPSYLVSLGTGFDEVIMLSKVLGLQFGLKSLIGGLGVDGLLLEDGQHAHGLLKEVNTGGQVHAEVHGDPGDALPHVLLLLQHEHVVIEKLLQLKKKILIKMCV